jgi:hypothetical protein
MFDPKWKPAKRGTRRPRRMDCTDCGVRVYLSRCGVDEHLRQKLSDTVCNGYVYIHENTGGSDCELADVLTKQTGD